MTELWGWLPAGGWQRVAVDAAWQGVLVGTVALLAIRLLRLRPATRAAAALTAALLCVAAPLGSAAARQAGWGLLSVAPLPESSAALAHHTPFRPTGSVSQLSTYEVPQLAPEPATGASTTQSTILRLLFGAWIAASSLFTLRLLRSSLAVIRACRSAAPCDDSEIHAALLQAARRLHVQPPLLAVTSAIPSPALMPWGTARLLLPVQIEPRPDWYAVFCHELAHLARRDGVSRLAIEIAIVALPWQPVLWLLRREFRIASEQACDDWAVAAGADPVEFASVLLDFVPQARPAIVLGMSESVATTRSRILRLLAMQDAPRPRLGRWFALTGWFVAAVLLVLLALLQLGRFPFGGGEELPPWGNMPVADASAMLPPSHEQPTKPYRAEPPDILLIDAVKIVPKPPYHIEPLDVLEISVLGTLPDQNIAGPHQVSPEGNVTLGPAYGDVKVSGLTVDKARDAIREQLENILTAPEVTVSIGESAGQQQIAGEHLIGPDGTVTLGVYGSVHVAGRTLAEARQAIEDHLSQYFENPRISVDVFAYNSKFYYVISENSGAGDQIVRVTCTGNERVLDALSQSRPELSAKSQVWIARPGGPDGSLPAKVLPVDWRAILRGESDATNHWVLPGDRIFISDPATRVRKLLKNASEATGEALSAMQEAATARY